MAVLTKTLLAGLALGSVVLFDTLVLSNRAEREPPAQRAAPLASAPIPARVVRSLRSRDEAERIGALLELGGVAGDAAHAAILAALRDVESVRRVALEALAVRAATDARARAALRHSADVDPSATLREFAQRALAERWCRAGAFDASCAR